MRVLVSVPKDERSEEASCLLAVHEEAARTRPIDVHCIAIPVRKGREASFTMVLDRMSEEKKYTGLSDFRTLGDMSLQQRLVNV